MSDMYCPTCKNGIHLNDAAFCYNDGTPLEKKPVCGHCGADTIASYTYCHKCGVRQESAVQA